jgi:hypothetical protein
MPGDGSFGCASVLSLEGRSAPRAVSDLCQITLTIVAHRGQMADSQTV